MQAMPAAAQSAATPPVVLFVTLPVKPGAMDGFFATMHKNLQGSRAEDGNVRDAKGASYALPLSGGETRTCNFRPALRLQC